MLQSLVQRRLLTLSGGGPSFCYEDPFVIEPEKNSFFLLARAGDNWLAVSHLGHQLLARVARFRFTRSSMQASKLS